MTETVKSPSTERGLLSTGPFNYSHQQNLCIIFETWSFAINLRVYALETKKQIVRIVSQIRVSLWIEHATIFKVIKWWVPTPSLAPTANPISAMIRAPLRLANPEKVDEILNPMTRILKRMSTRARMNRPCSRDCQPQQQDVIKQHIFDLNSNNIWEK